MNASRSIPSMLLEVKRRLLLRTRLGEALARAVRTRLGLRIAQDVYWDNRFGGWCGGARRANPFAALGATPDQSIHYAILDNLLREVPVRPHDVLVDVGCGRGRVINWWLRAGFDNRIIGLEIVPEIAERARRRLAPFDNVIIITGDALEHLPSDGSVFFLYNPFDEPVVRGFAQRLAELRGPGSDTRVIYLNARHVTAFDPQFWNASPLFTGARERAVLITPRMR